MAFPACAGDTQICRFIRIRNQPEGNGFELGTAPWTNFERNGRGLAVIVHETDCTQSGRFRVIVPRATHAVRCGGTSHPEADFKGPIPEFLDIILPFEFEGTDQRGSAAELVESEQPQRIPHEHTESCRANARIPKSPKHQ